MWDYRDLLISPAENNFVQPWQAFLTNTSKMGIDSEAQIENGWDDDKKGNSTGNNTIEISINHSSALSVALRPFPPLFLSIFIHSILVYLVTLVFLVLEWEITSLNAYSYTMRQVEVSGQKVLRTKKGTGKISPLIKWSDSKLSELQFSARKMAIWKLLLLDQFQKCCFSFFDNLTLNAWDISGKI